MFSELRVGPPWPGGKFQNPEIPHARGTEIIKGRTLVNDRAICRTRLPSTKFRSAFRIRRTFRTFRVSLNVLGDGFVEAVPDQTLLTSLRTNARKTTTRFAARLLYVPILEAPGQTGVGRFGWKDQHASLLSFSADAYLNEMGIHQSSPAR